MVWKLVLAIVLIAAVVEGNRWPCEKAKAKLDTCRENGFVIGDCKVGDGKMNERKRRRCEKMESKYEDKCGDYECEQESCSAGEYMTDDHECEQCPAGTWSEESASACNDCPRGKTSDAGSTSEDACYDDLVFRTQAKGVLFAHDWENDHFIVKTTSSIGSRHEIFFEVAGSNRYTFSRIVIRLSSTPIYYVGDCYEDTAMELPAAPDNVRIWKFIKNGFDGLTIECNEEVVAELRYDEGRYGCSTSRWTYTPVEFIKFNPDWDRTVGVGSYRIDA